MKPTPTDLYSSPDLGLVAFLVAKGIRLVRTESVTPRRVMFLLTPKDRCEELAVSFVSGYGLVRARAYNETMRALKGLVHSPGAGMA